MKRFVVLMLAGCLVLTACAPNADTKDSTEDITEDIPEEKDTEQEESKGVILPLPDTIDINDLDNCTVAISLAEGDAYVDDSGVMQMKVKVFVYDLYDMVDVAMLKTGDVLMVSGQEVTVDSLETSDYGDILINGGLDMGGIELRTDDNGVYYQNDYSDVKTWREIGEAVLPVSQEFIYTDSSDLDKEPVIWYPGDFLTSDSEIDYNFTPYNTTIVIEEGTITSMNRVYTP